MKAEYAQKPATGGTMAEKVPERNPKTTARYKHESWWQVVFPIVLLTGLLTLFVALILPLFGVAGASVMADYSFAFIFVLVTAFWFGGVIVIGGLIYAMAKALEVVPPNTYKAQKALKTARDVTDEYTDKMAHAIIEQRSRAVGAATLLEKLNADAPKPKQKRPEPAPPPTPTKQKVIIIRGKVYDK
jgi:hypothetical protein